MKELPEYLKRPSGPLADPEHARELAKSEADDAIRLPEFIELTGVGAGHYSIFEVTTDGVAIRDADSYALDEFSSEDQLAFLRARGRLSLTFPCSVDEFMSWYDRTRGENGVSDFPLAPAFERARPSPGGRFSPAHGAPVPTPTIIAAFRVRNVDADNKRWWSDKMRNAKKTGVVSARVSQGRSRTPASWAPLLVAAWLIEKGHMKPDAVRQTLREQFPDTDVDLLGA